MSLVRPIVIKPLNKRLPPKHRYLVAAILLRRWHVPYDLPRCDHRHLRPDLGLITL